APSRTPSAGRGWTPLSCRDRRRPRECGLGFGVTSCPAAAAPIYPETPAEGRWEVSDLGGAMLEFLLEVLLELLAAILETLWEQWRGRSERGTPQELA